MQIRDDVHTQPVHHQHADESLSSPVLVADSCIIVVVEMYE